MSDLSVWQPGKEPDLPAFPLALLGYQRKAVDAYLNSLPETPEGDSRVLEPRAIVAAPGNQLDTYRDLGREIGDLLVAVQETVARIRENAEIDAARWREEATTEVHSRVSHAQAASEELREAAWEVSTQMIGQIQEMELEAYRNIEKHSQEVIAEAENEAHRVREEARRRADTIQSNAHVESIELEERARTLCDQMIDSAGQKVAAIQERVSALERHRDQLLEEIGGIRSGAAPIGMKMVEQTGGLIYPTPSEEDEAAHVTPHHEMSGLVKLITPPEQSDDTPPPPETKETFQAPTLPPAEPKGEGEESATGEETPAPPLDDLFTSLRRTIVPLSQTAEHPPEQSPSPAGRIQVDEEQSIELREEMLLPISNQFLRLFKRLLTEEQNRVLEGLRTGELEWGVEEVDARLRPHLEMLMEQSRQAGHRAAEQLSGRDLPRPKVELGAETGFTAQLVAEVTEAMGAESASESPQRGRLASRTFRVWRSEKLERILREASESHYQQGLSESLATAGVTPT